MWDRQHLTTLWASTARYRDTFTFFYLYSRLFGNFVINSVNYRRHFSKAKSIQNWSNYKLFFLSLSLMEWDWVNFVLQPLFGLSYQPRMIDDNCGAIGGMWSGKGNRSTRRKPAPVSFCPPQILHVLTRARTRAAAVGSRRLTAWAMARPQL
jgi:hypothetical protein